MNKTEQLITALAAPVVESQGCELWDVEYLREAGQWYLRVYIDRPGGVSIQDCEAVSRALDPILDERDPIPDSYTFEVSSAGAERELKRPSDFQRFMGERCEVRLYQPLEGSKTWTGELTGYDDGDVTLRTAKNEMLFKKPQIAQVRLSVF